MNRHGRIPCGICDDHARVASRLEDVATIHKALPQIADPAGKPDPQSQNRLVRWFMHKERAPCR